MKRTVLVVALILVLCAGCNSLRIQTSAPKKERPTVNLPVSLRQSNWIGRAGEGSCAWATIVSILRWQGQPGAAEWVRRNCGDGGEPGNMGPVFDRAGIRYAWCTQPDVEFLEWSCRTRRGCGISVPGRSDWHFVALVYLDDKWAAMLDNNAVDKYIWISRSELLERWKKTGNWAMTVVYSPSAPLPK